MKFRIRGLDLEPLPLSFVAVFFRRVRTTAESLPQEVCLHTTGEEDQLSQDVAACHTLKVPREAGVLAFPDRILVGAQGGSVASFPVLVLPLVATNLLFTAS